MTGYKIVSKDDIRKGYSDFYKQLPAGNKSIVVCDSWDWVKINGLKEAVKDLKEEDVDFTTQRLLIYKVLV